MGTHTITIRGPVSELDKLVGVERGTEYAFNILDNGDGWYFEHLDEKARTITESESFGSSVEALQAAISYARAAESDRRAEAERKAEEARYGSYEQQVRRYWESTRL